MFESNDPISLLGKVGAQNQIYYVDLELCRMCEQGDGLEEGRASLIRKMLCVDQKRATEAARARGPAVLYPLQDTRQQGLTDDIGTPLSLYREHG